MKWIAMYLFTRKHINIIDIDLRNRIYAVIIKYAPSI
jgi:hypothetical protein